MPIHTKVGSYETFVGFFKLCKEVFVIATNLQVSMVANQFFIAHVFLTKMVFFSIEWGLGFF